MSEFIDGRDGKDFHIYDLRLIILGYSRWLNHCAVDHVNIKKYCALTIHTITTKLGYNYIEYWSLGVSIFLFLRHFCVNKSNISEVSEKSNKK